MGTHMIFPIEEQIMSYDKLFFSKGSKNKKEIPENINFLFNLA